jgi:CrcB protein
MKINSIMKEIKKSGGYMLHYIFIALGGALGATSRYLIDLYISSHISISFPIGTLLANLIGCFIIGISFRIFHHDIIHNKFNPFIITGFLGALTTFSSYAYATLVLFEDGRYLAAGGNLLLNNIFGILFAYLGARLTNYLVKEYFPHRFKGDE